MLKESLKEPVTLIWMETSIEFLTISVRNSSAHLESVSADQKQ